MSKDTPHHGHTALQNICQVLHIVSCQLSHHFLPAHKPDYLLLINVDRHIAAELPGQSVVTSNCLTLAPLARQTQAVDVARSR